MTYIITFLEKNRKSSVYIVGDICVIYCYLEMIGDPTTLTTSVQRSHHLSPSTYIKNDTTSLQLVIAALCTIQKSIREGCGRIGHKADAWIIRGPNYSHQVLEER